MSLASDTCQESPEVAEELLRKSAMVIQLFLKEHDCLIDDEHDYSPSDGHQQLSDTLEDIVDVLVSKSTPKTTSRIHKLRGFEQIQHKLTD